VVEKSNIAAPAVGLQARMSIQVQNATQASTDMIHNSKEAYAYSAPKASAWVIEHYPKLAPMEHQMQDNVPGGLPIK
jgi:hypothetical protein